MDQDVCVPHPASLFDLLLERLASQLHSVARARENTQVSFNIRGNEWQGKHYVNLNAWRIQDRGGGGGGEGTVSDDGFYSPPDPSSAAEPVASSAGKSASPFDEPFSSYTSPSDAPSSPEAKKDDIPF